MVRRNIVISNKFLKYNVIRINIIHIIICQQRWHHY
jgi:hypothetical protein